MLLNIRKQILNGSVLESVTIHIRWILRTLHEEEYRSSEVRQSNCGFITNKFHLANIKNYKPI